MTHPDSFGARSTLTVGQTEHEIFRLDALQSRYDVARLLYNPWAGLFAAALMVVAFPQVYFSREARPYALLIAFGLGTLDALARIERSGANWRRLLALGGCALAMALTAGVGALFGAVV